MNLEYFIETFSRLFFETDRNLLIASCEFKMLDEWSSMMAITVISMVYDNYHVIIDGNEIRDSETIEDLYKLIVSKVNN